MKKMSAPGSPSLLARLRSTPGSLRRKFRKAQSLNLNDTPPSTPSRENKMNHSSRKLDESGESRTSHPFTCRFLGLMSIYTLNPEHCYGFAEGLAKAAVDGDGKEVNNNIPTNKCQILVKNQSIEILPTDKRQFHKRKPHSVGSPPLRQSNTMIGSTTPYHQNRFSSVRPRTVSCDELSSEEHKRDSSFSFLNSNSSRDSPQISVFTPPVYPDRGGRTMTSKPTTVFQYPDNSSQYCQGVSAMPENCQENFATSITLHNVAYCVTVPSNPRIFLLTSRQGTCLVCRVFLFSRREKAQALTLVLANQFKQSFLEWQNTKHSRRKSSVAKENRPAGGGHQDLPQQHPLTATKKGLARSYSARDSLNHRIESDPNKDSGHEDLYSSQDDLDDLDSDEKTNEELAKMKEFTRRASCMEKPESLLADGMTIEKLEKYCDNIFLNSDDCTTDDERESDESDERSSRVLSGR